MSLNAHAAGGLFDVSGRRVVVTGGTAGIGLAVAEHLVAHGAQVVIGGRRSDGETIAERIGASFVLMDVTDERSTAQAFERVAERFDTLDALILNAGVNLEHGEIESLNAVVFERVFDVNTVGVARSLRLGIGAVRDGGSVIITSSPAGSVAVSGMAAYAGSKAAVDHMVRVWAMELGPRQIRVNAVLPGIVETEMTDLAGSAPTIELIRRMTASGIVRQPDEMAPVFHFLVSDASASLTGSLVGCHDGISAGFSQAVISSLAAGVAAK